MHLSYFNFWSKPQSIKTVPREAGLIHILEMRLFSDYPFSPPRMLAAYETVERLIVALGCPRTVNIELLAHSLREVTSACSPCPSRDLLSTNTVLQPILGLLEVGGCLTWAL